MAVVLDLILDRVSLYTALMGYLVVFYVSIVIFYRLFLHPYAKYPGPLLAKLTDCYALYHAYIGDLHQHVAQCHEKYGDYVRYAPNRVLINTSDALRDIYTHGQNTNKAKTYLALSAVKNATTTLTTRDKVDHSYKRRILSEGLGDSSLKSLEPLILKNIDIWIRRLAEKQDDFSPAMDLDREGWSCPKDMGQWTDYLTFDVMSDLVFSRAYHMLEKKDNHFIAEAFLGQTRRGGFLSQFAGLEYYRLHLLLYPDAYKNALRFSQASKKILETRLADKNPNRKDVYSKLLAAKDPETGRMLSPTELWAESNLLIVAGSDTTSTALGATFFYLSHYPEAYAKLATEVRTTFKTATEIRMGPLLNSCVYLRACLDEAMRMCPPVGGPLWREVLDGGHTINNEFFPSGTEVGVGVYSIHHNPAYYPDPFIYHPERWIVSADNSKDNVRRAQAAFNPFSIGPRGCVGRALAVTEMTLAMARLLYQLDFRLAEGELGRVGEGEGDEGVEGRRRNVYRTRFGFTSQKKGPWIQFRRRRGGDGLSTA